MRRVIIYAMFITLNVALCLTAYQMREYKTAAADSAQAARECLDLVHRQKGVMAEYRQQINLNRGDR